MEFIKQLITVGTILGIFDYVWLNFVFLEYWKKMVTNIQLKPLWVNSSYIVPIYILLTLSIIVYVLPKIRDDNILFDSIKYGGLLGFIIYGIFDFTNLVTFENYSLNIALTDIAWGTFLFTIVTFLSKKILIKLKHLV